MKCNAMQWKKRTKNSDIGLLVLYEGVMNERSVAVSTVTGSRICGCSEGTGVVRAKSTVL